MSKKLSPDNIIQQVHDETNEALKVNIVAGSGISITADNLDVSLTHDGAEPDSVQIGDGTEILSITPAGEALVSVNSSVLPTGAATSANQATEIARIEAVRDRLPTSVGAKTEAESLSVALATDTGDLPVALKDAAGNAITSTSNALDVNLKSGTSIAITLDQADDSVLAFGFDGTTNRAIKTDAAGELQVDVLSSALPTGAATAANQVAGNASLSSIDGKLPALAGGRIPVDIGGSGSITVTSGTITVANSVEITNDVGSPIPISAASLPLPTGAATEATLSAVNTKTPALVSGRVPVDGSGVTQPVSAASLPLPTGAATETTLAALNTKTPGLGQATMANSRPVVIASNQSAVPVSGTVSVTGVATETTLAAANAKLDNGTQRTRITDGTNNAALSASAPAGTEQGLIVRNIPSGTQAVSAASLPLPTGAATAANQTTGNTSLSNIDTKTPALVSGRVPVDGSGVTQPVSGTVSVNSLPAGTNNIGDVDIASLPAPLNIVGSGVGTSSLRVQLADESLAALENISVTVTNSAVEITNDAGSPIPVSGTVALDSTSLSALESITVQNGAGASAVNIQDGGNSITVDGAVSISGSVAVTGPLTDAQLRATAVPVSASSLPLPTGAATETTLSALNTKVPANLTVTATRLLVDGSGVTQPVSGTVSVTGVATAANQVTQTSELTAIKNAVETIDNAIAGSEMQVDVVTLPAPLNTTGAGAAASALRVQLADESLSALENINVTLSASTVSVDNFPATQAVSATNLDIRDLTAADVVTVTGGAGQTDDIKITLDGESVAVTGTVSVAGVATAANQTTANASLASIDSKLTSPLTVTGALTDAQLRASAVPVSVSGVATEAKQDSQITELQAIKAAVETIDNAIAGSEMQVDVVSSVLPTGAATEATLAAVNTKTPALISGRVPVNTEGQTIRPDTFIGKFRETFESWPSANFTETKHANDIIIVDGDAVGSSFLTISKCPITPGTESYVDTVLNFEMPVEIGVGAHLSQNFWGQDFSIEMLDTEFLTPVADMEISAISQTTTTLTVTTTSPHGLAPGKRIGIRDCSDSRANYPSLVVAAIVGPNTFTATAGPNSTIPSLTIANPSGAKGFVYFRPALSGSRNGTSLHFEAPSTGLGFFYTRASAGDSLPFASGSGNSLVGRQAVAVASTASAALVSSPFTTSFAPTTEYRLTCQADRLNWLDQTIDGVASVSNRCTRTQVVPNAAKQYFLRIKARTEPSCTLPTAEIASVSKSGSTTATVTTVQPHGLVTGDLVFGYGVRDVGTGFYPALTTAAAVTVTGADTFTVVWGTSATNTSYGGYIAKSQSNCPVPGAVSQSIQSIAKSTLSDGRAQLVVVGSATWTGMVIGDLVNLHGVRDSSGNLLPQDPNGRWKVANISTTTLTLVSIPTISPSLSDFTTATCGGAVIKRSDFRISYVRIFDFVRHRVEILHRGSGDAAQAITVGGAVLAAITSGTVTTVSAVTAANLAIPGIIADVASAAITTTTTTAALTPTFGTAYRVTIPVTAASGTNRTMDVSIEESDDSGVNWFKVYDFPRITDIGYYQSPTLTLRGNRVRYVQTISGTTPSFTRAINRLQISRPGSNVVQLINRTINLNTLNSTSNTILVDNCVDFNMSIHVVSQSTAAEVALQMSDDGVNWYTHPGGITTVVGVNNYKLQNEQWKFARAIVTAAGTSVVYSYVQIKGVGV